MEGMTGTVESLVMCPNYWPVGCTEAKAQAITWDKGATVAQVVERLVQ